MAVGIVRRGGGRFGFEHVVGAISRPIACEGSETTTASPLDAPRQGRVPSGRAPGPAGHCRTAVSHWAYFASGSSTATPVGKDERLDASGEALISWFGLSTRQTWPPE